MPSLFIKDFPVKLHRKLKQQAAHHHHSMADEAIAILEQALSEAELPKEVPPPFKGSFALTEGFISRARRYGRGE